MNICSFPLNGSRCIKRTTCEQRLAIWHLHLTMHVTRKSIGIIYSLWTSIVPRLATFKQSCQNILISNCLVYRRINRQTDRPTDGYKTILMCALFKRGDVPLKGSNYVKTRSVYSKEPVQTLYCVHIALFCLNFFLLVWNGEPTYLSPIIILKLSQLSHTIAYGSFLILFI